MVVENQPGETLWRKPSPFVYMMDMHEPFPERTTHVALEISWESEITVINSTLFQISAIN